MRRPVFIGRLAATFPAEIIVEDQQASRRELRVKMLETDPCRVIPVTIKPEHGDAAAAERVGELPERTVRWKVANLLP